MLGPIGTGKSSFFNTINSTFQERIAKRSMSGSDISSMTKKYREYPIWSPRNDSELNFRLCDTCGIVVNGPPDLADLDQLVEGHVPDGYEFSEKLIDKNIKGFISNPALQDKVHCVAYVFAANSLKTIDEITWFKLNELQRRLHIRVKEAVDFVSQKLNVDPGDVMPIKNYESESMVNNTISSLAMQALDRMLGYASDYMENKHHLMQQTQS
ncbi:hypothetical protein CHS0354_025995 [Potamilus streckersoni]|uniref:Interferon-induced protein 44-like n=1 Tax=Potamilus streckersoni TaxID=2493646 RepID=A0AAE0T554_9BIVA|nr:hypothetical protein CHS0354_025995 [Potamilus streckersoni]